MCPNVPPPRRTIPVRSRGTRICPQTSRSCEAISPGSPVLETRPHTHSSQCHSPRNATQGFEKSHCSLCRALLPQACGRQTGSSLLLLQRRDVFPRPQRDPHGRCATYRCHFHSMHTHVSAPPRLTTSPTLDHPLCSCMVVHRGAQFNEHELAERGAGPASATTVAVRTHGEHREMR